MRVLWNLACYLLFKSSKKVEPPSTFVRPIKTFISHKRKIKPHSMNTQSAAASVCDKTVGSLAQSLLSAFELSLKIS